MVVQTRCRVVDLIVSSLHDNEPTNDRHMKSVKCIPNIWGGGGD